MLTGLILLIQFIGEVEALFTESFVLILSVRSKGNCLVTYPISFYTAVGSKSRNKIMELMDLMWPID